MRTDNTPFNGFSCCESSELLSCMLPGVWILHAPILLSLAADGQQHWGALSVCECDYCVSVMTVYSTFRRGLLKPKLLSKASSRKSKSLSGAGLGAEAALMGPPPCTQRGLSQADAGWAWEDRPSSTGEGLLPGCRSA